jgi:uncharacterized protein YkvS
MVKIDLSQVEVGQMVRLRDGTTRLIRRIEENPASPGFCYWTNDGSYDLLGRYQGDRRSTEWDIVEVIPIVEKSPPVDLANVKVGQRVRLRDGFIGEIVKVGGGNCLPGFCYWTEIGSYDLLGRYLPSGTESNNDIVEILPFEESDGIPGMPQEDFNALVRAVARAISKLPQ